MLACQSSYDTASIESELLRLLRRKGRAAQSRYHIRANMSLFDLCVDKM
jgi:hypothetical protein